MSKKFKISDDVRTFIFKPEKNLNWQAGQFMHYFLPHDNVDKRGDDRYFTISSAPFEKFIQITTRYDNLPISSFKTTLWNLLIGAKIEAEGPEGEFVVKSEMKRMLWLSGGIGITPFRSIINELNHNGELKTKKIQLLYANRDKNIIFEDELNKISTINPENFKIKYLIDPERIDAVEIEKYLGAKTYYFVSGPKTFVEAMTTTLRELNVTKNYLISDYFPGYTKY